MSGIEIEKICVICNDETHAHHDVHTKSCYGVNEIVYENTYGGVIKTNGISAVPIVNENYGSILVNFNANFDNFSVNNTTLTIPSIRSGIGLEPIVLPTTNPNDGQILKYDGQNKTLYWGTDVFGGDGDSGSINNLLNLLINQDLTVGRDFFVENDISANGNFSTYGDICANDVSFSDLSANNVNVLETLDTRYLNISEDLQVGKDVKLNESLTCGDNITPVAVSGKMITPDGITITFL